MILKNVNLRGLTLINCTNSHGRARCKKQRKYILKVFAVGEGIHTGINDPCLTFLSGGYEETSGKRRPEDPH